MVFKAVEDIIATTRVLVKASVNITIVALGFAVIRFITIPQHHNFHFLDSRRLDGLLYFTVLSVIKEYSFTSAFRQLEIPTIAVIIPQYHQFKFLYKDYADFLVPPR